jgi:hypothetical protein
MGKLSTSLLEHLTHTYRIAGPIIGASFPPSSQHDETKDYPPPRAVNEEYFEEVCPRERRRRINLNEVNKSMHFAEGSEILDYYVRMIDGIGDGCLEFYGKDEYIFDWR